MNITEHEMHGLLAGKCLPGDMRVNEELPAYLVRKFAELKAERDALATEAMLQGWVACSPEWIERNGACSCETAPRIAFGDIGPHYHPHSFAQATDAYLNSVRADAVVKAAAHLGDMAAGKSASTAELIKSCGRTLLSFAAQLRAGESS